MRQTLVGVVVGTAMRKTAKVRVASQRMHPRVHKIVTCHKNFLAHDESEDCSLGDVVRIEACRPLSALKRFVVSEIIKPARTWQDPETGEVKR
ncbi:12139_t:CDS:2 [Ambispora gerdemannii]|uniref:12139_t:CDS:1 n=1 Tax=Ambispora gerdemannii TaxID=144530 RepID=A0A9N8UWA1_9GLOM|nr:12139_t:CDS:2 [Ambispora gerdemannii]